MEKGKRRRAKKVVEKPVLVEEEPEEEPEELEEELEEAPEEVSEEESEGEEPEEEEIEEAPKKKKAVKKAAKKPAEKKPAEKKPAEKKPAEKKPVKKAKKEKESEDAQDEAEPARVPIVNVLGLSISPARVEYYMRDVFISPETKANIEEKQEEIKQAEGKEEKAALREELAILKKESGMPRISGNTHIAITATVDFAIKELVEFVIEIAQAEKKKTISVQHLHSADVGNLVSFPFWANLPKYVNYVEKDEEDEEAEEEEHKKNTFETYVAKAIKTVKEKEKFTDENIRVSKDIKSYLSDMVIELVSTITRIVKSTIAEFNKSQTVDVRHVFIALKAMLMSGGKSDEEVEEFAKKVRGVMENLEKYLASEKERKFSELSEEKKNEIAEKKRAQEETKERKKIEESRKRIANQFDKIKKLAIEQGGSEETFDPVAGSVIEDLVKSFGGKVVTNNLRKLSKAKKKNPE